MNPRYQAGWVHQDICRRLEKFSADVAAGLSPRLMLLMPPRSGKSELCSRSFPAWHLGKHPNHEVIACSYNVSLAMTFSKKVKELLQDPVYHPVFDIRLDPNNQSAEEWALDRSIDRNHAGGYVAAGVGGGITGKGCFSLDTTAQTRRGIIAMGQLQVGDFVLAYDHETEQAVFAPVLAIHAARHAIGTGTYSGVRCTSDHPLYSPATRRYHPAASVEQQDLPVLRWAEVGELKRVHDVQASAAPAPSRPQGVPTLWCAQSDARDDVRSVLPGSTQLDGRAGMRAMSQSVQSVGRRSSEKSPQVRPHVLLQRLFASVSGAAKAPRYVRSLRSGAEQQGPEGVLWARVLRRAQTWVKHLHLWPRQIVQRGVSAAEATSVGEGWPDMRHDRRQAGAGGSPHRPQPRKQPDGQPDYLIEDGARAISRNAGCTAESLATYVRRTGSEPHVVVDIQTGTGNFFADGVLAHNCHVLVIDDPLKNAEEADSADTREKLWDWYGSTAYTRLAPGGGVLVVQCMVGDTPVLMADGAQRRLDSLVRGDEIATFDRGNLATSKIAGIRSNGRDSILEITTSSGKMVRANGRHPFLVALNGELKWIRARSLNTAHKIVAFRGSGESGKESLAQQTAATSLPRAEDSARLTTTGRSGLTEPAPQVSTPHHGAKPTSNIGTASPSTSTTTLCWSREESAQSAGNRPAPPPQQPPTTGKASSPLITATIPAKSAGSSATTATQESDILELSPWHLPQPNTYDFTLDEIVSIAPACMAEVFDLQVERTENFIANGLVSHNTWWHDDDLAGRLQVAMASDPEADQFVVVKYPAIAESDEYLDQTSDLIVDIEPEGPHKLLRLKGEALHPERYDLTKLNQIKRTISPRFWSALYQQNPVPDDGAYFLKEHFRRAPVPHITRANVFIAWDFAISEKKTNDYTVGTVLMQDEDDVLHVAEQVRFKSGDGLFICDAILALSKKWYTPGQQLGFEDGQIYRAIESLLKKRMQEQRHYPSIQVLKPITDKLARARPLQGRMQQGMVSFNSADDGWYDTCRLEMLRFPAGAHDDCVDSVSWATQMAIGRQAPRKITHKEPESWRKKLSSRPNGSYMSA